ncbi:MAG: hypothetical protein ABMA02_16845 [Saprospiraceae bacterium]
MSDIQLHFSNIRAIIRQGKANALQAATAHSLAAYWNVARTSVGA